MDNPKREKLFKEAVKIFLDRYKKSLRKPSALFLQNIKHSRLRGALTLRLT
jgi:hypothetical protein